jgi:hypothetical protein
MSGIARIAIGLGCDRASGAAPVDVVWFGTSAYAPRRDLPHRQPILKARAECAQ